MLEKRLETTTKNCRTGDSPSRRVGKVSTTIFTCLDLGGGAGGFGLS